MQKYWRHVKFLLTVSVISTSLPALAVDYYVDPDGSDRNGGNLSDSPLQSIQTAIDKAKPGDTIILAPGTYMQDFITQTDGTQTQPITITGSSNAVIKGGGRGRIVEINHSYTNLNGFTVDGLKGDPNSADSYSEKLIYVQGKKEDYRVEGVKITNMNIMNAGGECIRLRYLVNNSEIGFNTIKNCGVRDFKIEGMKNGKNGEGIYVGTAPEQTEDGKNPTSDLDQSSNNWIHHNTIDTQGNECVDIKEGSAQNIVENNTCTGQKDPKSAGLDSRGNDNIFRYNNILRNKGSGVRLGGDTAKDGINNQVWGNNINNNAGGGIKFEREPQQKNCGNKMGNNTGGDSVGTFGSYFSPSDNCAFSN